MRPVRQNDKNGTNGAGARWGVGVLALALLVSGCAETGSGSGSAPGPGSGADADAAKPAHGRQVRLQAPPARALDAYRRQE